MFTTTTSPSALPPATAGTGGNPWLLWRTELASEREVLSVAELAECRCPDLCDRDHANE